MKSIRLAFALIMLALPVTGFPAGTVTQARLGTGVVDRELVGETTSFAPGQQAWLWMRVEDAADETLTATFRINDLEFPVELHVGASPWRTWAMKTLHIAGEWTVTVTDSAGNVLHESHFSVR